MVAVKYFKPNLLQSERDFRDFLSEAALLKKLSHSSIVRFVGVAIETGTPSQQDLSTPHKRMGQKSIDFLQTLLESKKPECKLIEKDSALTMPTLDDSEDNTISIGKIMIVQEHMKKKTLKSLMFKQMEHPRKKIYTKTEALEWLIQIAKGLR